VSARLDAVLRPRAREVAVLALAAAVAIGLRLHGLGARSYWTDEFFSLQTSNGLRAGELFRQAATFREPTPRLTQLAARRPWPEIVKALRTDNHPPLFFWVLRFWREHVADGERATRAIAVVCSLAALVLTWATVRRRAGPWAAGACALLLALSAQQVRYAQETRGYSMAVAFVALAAFAVDRLAAGGGRRRWSSVLGTSALAAMLAHYYALGALAGLAGFTLLALPRPARRAAVVAFGLAGLAFLALWGRVLGDQRHHVLPNNGWSLEAEADHGLVTLERLAVWPAEVLADVTRGDPAPAVGLGAFAWFAILFAARDRASHFWLSVIAGSVLVVLAVDVGLSGRQLEIPRYTLFAAPAVAAVLATLPGRFAGIVPVLAFGLLAARLPAAYAPDRPAWRELAQRVSAASHPREIIVVVGPSHKVNDDPLWVYQALIHYAWAPDRGFALVRGRPSRALRVALRRRKTALFVAPAGIDLSCFPPFRVEEQFPDSADLPRVTRLRFAAHGP
jgi:hypothetical protein